MGAVMNIGTQPGEGLQHREAEDDVRRRRRLRPGEAGDRRGRRLPEEPREVQGDRRAHPEGCAARRSAGHRQDPHRPRGRRRGRRAVRVGDRLRLHGDVRRRRRGARARPLPDRPQAGAGDHLRRRDRLDRPQARRRPRWRARRARADAEPDARRDGRLRGDRGHRDDGGDQPPRRPRPRAAPPRSLRPPDHGAAADAGRARTTSCRCTSATRRSSPDVDVDVVARGTPGMSGADLSNLVNEAALFAVRRGDNEVHAERLRRRTRPRAHGPAPRRRWRHERAEKEVIAYHEGGHAVRGLRARARRPGAQGHDPAHRHGARRHAAAARRGAPHPTRRSTSPTRSSCASVAASPRSSCSGTKSTGAQNDLVGAPRSPARWCGSGACRDRIGPMAWGSQGAVFLGEDLVHTRDYSDETARVIDEEVERILRDEENRTRTMLTEHRAGLERGGRGAARARDPRRRRRSRRWSTRRWATRAAVPGTALRADGTEEVVETSCARAIRSPTTSSKDSGATRTQNRWLSDAEIAQGT